MLNQGKLRSTFAEQEVIIRREPLQLLQFCLRIDHFEHTRGKNWKHLNLIRCQWKHSCHAFTSGLTSADASFPHKPEVWVLHFKTPSNKQLFFFTSSAELWCKQAFTPDRTWDSSIPPDHGISQSNPVLVKMGWFTRSFVSVMRIIEWIIFNALWWSWHC